MFQETLAPEPNNETDILRKVFHQQAASCAFDWGRGEVERGFHMVDQVHSCNFSAGKTQARGSPV